MTRCQCNRAAPGSPLPRAGAHFEPSCPHSTAYFIHVLAPILSRLSQTKKRRGRAFIDPNGHTAGLVLFFPREHPIPIPVIRGRVKGTKSVLRTEAA